MASFRQYGYIFYKKGAHYYHMIPRQSSRGGEKHTKVFHCGRFADSPRTSIKSSMTQANAQGSYAYSGRLNPRPQSKSHT